MAWFKKIRKPIEAPADKSRVLVLLLQPTIIVEEEERSRGKNP